MKNSTSLYARYLEICISLFLYFFLNLHFPTLFFTILTKIHNFHENRIFFTNLYFYTEYAILVNPNIKASLLQIWGQKNRNSRLFLSIITINMMISHYNTVSITLQVPFFPTSIDYASKAIVRGEHKYSAQAAQHSA